MKRMGRVRRLLLPVLTAVFASVLMAGCHGKSEHPKGEHPTTGTKKADHPKKEHPKKSETK